MKVAKVLIIFTLLLAFTVCISAQSNSYPNELKGYRFFRNGKLKNLRLGFSTNDDVKKIFGQDCEDNCDYNPNWEITFSYFRTDSCFTSQTGDEPKLTFCPDRKYIGKLLSIELRPKKIVSFSKVLFANFGVHGGGSSIGEDGQGHGTHTSYNSFGDKYGLTYTIFERVVSSTETNPTEMKKGDLLSIEYEVPDKLSKKIYIRQK